MDSLATVGSIRDLKDAAKKLPSGSDAYNSLYEAALKRVFDGNEADLARRLLTWVTFAKRPLSVEELCHALATEDGDEDFDEDGIRDVNDYVSVCAGLVITSPSGQLRLVHTTTQEYMERDQVRHKWFPTLDQDLASTCITYISFQSFSRGIMHSKEEIRLHNTRFPLLRYAATNWLAHLCDFEKRGNFGESQALLDLIRNLTNQPRNITALDQAIGRSFVEIRYQRTMWHLLAQDDVPLCVQALLETEPFFDTADSDGRTPLWYATAEGISSVFDIFVRHSGIPKHFSEACIVAIQYNWGEIIDRVLNTTTLATFRTHHFSSLFEAAIRYNQNEILYQFLEKIDRTSDVDVLFDTAARYSRLDIFRVLLKYAKAHSELQDDCRVQAVCAAFGRGGLYHPDTSESKKATLFLKDLIEDPDFPVNDERIFMKMLRSNPADEPLLLLLLSRCDLSVCRQNPRGWTLLNTSISHGSEELITTILRHPSFDSDKEGLNSHKYHQRWQTDKMGSYRGHWAALCRAVQRGNKTAVRCLVADPRVTNLDLCICVEPPRGDLRNGEVEAIEVLLEYPRAWSDNAITTLLKLAVHNRHIRLVCSLLSPCTKPSSARQIVDDASLSARTDTASDILPDHGSHDSKRLMEERHSLTFIAIRRQMDDIALALLEDSRTYPMQINQVSQEFGRTLLAEAAAYGLFYVVRAILQFDQTDVTIPGPEGVTALGLSLHLASELSDDAQEAELKSIGSMILSRLQVYPKSCQRIVNSDFRAMSRKHGVSSDGRSSLCEHWHISQYVSLIEESFPTLMLEPDLQSPWQWYINQRQDRRRKEQLAVEANRVEAAHQGGADLQLQAKDKDSSQQQSVEGDRAKNESTGDQSAIDAQQLEIVKYYSEMCNRSGSRTPASFTGEDTNEDYTFDSDAESAPFSSSEEDEDATVGSG